MADASQTPANVTWVSGVRPTVVKAGATVAAGQPVYRDTSDNEYKLGDADTDAASEIEGLSLSGGVDGRDMLLALPGSRINVGFTATAGTIYVLSTTAGGIAPWADLAQGDFVCILFIGEGTAFATLLCEKGPVAHA